MRRVVDVLQAIELVQDLTKIGQHDLPFASPSGQRGQPVGRGAASGNQARTPLQETGQPPNPIQRLRTVADLLDAHVDVGDRPLHLGAMKVTVDVHATGGNPAQGAHA